MSDDSKLSSYLFYVEIDGIETARFQKCEGLEAETESFEYVLPKVNLDFFRKAYKVV